MKKFYLTTAIAYVNAAPHLGHAMEFIEADAIVRYRRLMGDDAYFLTGTDEHGIKNYQSAQKAGMDTQAFVDQNAAIFKSLRLALNLSYDDFIRTTDRVRHYPACQKLWKKLMDGGDIYKKEYQGLYCEGCEVFVMEKDLVDGNCVIHKRPPTPLNEENYFFRLSKYSEQIGRLIESDTLRILPSSRKAEILNMVREGLHDVSFSRPRTQLPWGVPVPGDDTQVMYVWCDALTNYISAIGYTEESPLFKKLWPVDLHVIGKDIVRFHAGIWIGMLLSAGVEIPKAIFVHGFVTHNGEKMSKTLGNVVDPLETVQKFGTDPLRYYLLREIAVGKDGDFSDTLFVERYNSDLANNLGNLVNRVHTLVTRYEVKNFEFDPAYAEKVAETWKQYTAEMEQFNLHEGIFHVWRLIDYANKVMEDTKPWGLMKTDPEKGRLVLCSLLEIIRHISILITPFIPEAAGKIRRQIGLPEAVDSQKERGWAALKNWKSVGEAAILFPRIEAVK